MNKVILLSYIQITISTILSLFPRSRYFPSVVHTRGYINFCSLLFKEHTFVCYQRKVSLWVFLPIFWVSVLNYIFLITLLYAILCCSHINGKTLFFTFLGQTVCLLHCDVHAHRNFNLCSLLYWESDYGMLSYVVHTGRGSFCF